jgi:hypothetical protein
LATRWCAKAMPLTSVARPAIHTIRPRSRRKRASAAYGAEPSRGRQTGAWPIHARANRPHRSLRRFRFGLSWLPGLSAADDLGHGPDESLGAFDFGRKLLPGMGGLEIRRPRLSISGCVRQFTAALSMLTAFLRICSHETVSCQHSTLLIFLTPQGSKPDVDNLALQLRFDAGAQKRANIRFT